MRTLSGKEPCRMVSRGGSGFAITTVALKGGKESSQHAIPLV